MCCSLIRPFSFRSKGISHLLTPPPAELGHSHTAAPPLKPENIYKYPHLHKSDNIMTEHLRKVSEHPSFSLSKDRSIGWIWEASVGEK